MELSKQITNKEISQRLKELGVKQESLYNWAKDFDTSMQGWQLTTLSQVEDREMYSAFTVAELGEMLPTDIKIKKRTYWLNTARMSHGWSVGYVSRKGDYYLMNEHESIEVTEADARGKMLIYLLENHLITN